MQQIKLATDIKCRTMFSVDEKKEKTKEDVKFLCQKGGTEKKLSLR